MIETQYRRVFSDENAAGDTAAVLLIRGGYSLDEFVSITHMHAVGVCCFVTKQSDQQWQVRIFDKTREVTFCVHGLLAAADVISGWTGSIDTTIQTPSISVQVHQLNGEVWLGLEKTSLVKPGEVESFIDDVLEPVAVANSQSHDGYLVIELDIQTKLERISLSQLNVEKLGSRALILTKRSAVPGFDYEFRYFAPQYGVTESPASGSGNAILLSYWSDRLNQRRYRSLQRSPKRAVHLGRVEGERVWLSGRIDSISIEDL